MSASWCACETVDGFAIKGRCYARRIGSFVDLLYVYAAQFRRPHLILGHSYFLGILLYRADLDIQGGSRAVVI